MYHSTQMLTRATLTRRLVLLVGPLLMGCYVYQPVADVRPAAGQRVRLRLTDSGTANLAAQLGPSTENLSGRLLGDSTNGYLVSVLGTQKRGGVETGWNGEQVIIPQPYVAVFEQRRFSRTRTVLMGVATVMASLALREVFWGAGIGAFGGGGPGGGPGRR
jgi:hypothetical protein